MKLPLLFVRPSGRLGLVLLVSSMSQGCAVQWGAEIQWSSRSQILMSEDSQVKLRSIQSRVFDTRDRAGILRATVAMMQDFFFDIDVLDEELGVVSGKKWFHHDSDWSQHPTYYLYKTDELIIFNTNFRSWGPFKYRNDLVRMTVTVRPKEETRLLVRASVQYNLRAVEHPETYQKLFKALQQAMFLASRSSGYGQEAHRDEPGPTPEVPAVIAEREIKRGQPTKPERVVVTTGGPDVAAE